MKSFLLFFLLGIFFISLSSSNAEVSIERIYPIADFEIEQDNFFNITVNVTCISGNCGEMNVSFDPILPISCADVKARNSNAPSGIYNISFNESEPVSVYCDLSLDGGAWMLVGVIGDPRFLPFLNDTITTNYSRYTDPNSSINWLHPNYTLIKGYDMRVGRMVGNGTNFGNFLEINNCTTGDAGCWYGEYISQNDGDTFGAWITNGDLFTRHVPSGCTTDQCPTLNGDRDYNQTNRVAIFGGDCHSTCNSGGNRTRNGFIYRDYGTASAPNRIGNRAYWGNNTVYFQNNSLGDLRTVSDYGQAGTMYRTLWVRDNSTEAKGGLISTVTGDTPFYTNESNPRVITLNEGESQLVTAWVNATGDPGDYLFFEYVNSTSVLDVYDNSSLYNVTILDLVFPKIEVLYPLNNTTYPFLINSLNFSIIDRYLNSCWYSLDLGQTNISFNCENNITNLTSSAGLNNWIIWSNDTSGNLNMSSLFFTSEIPQVNITRIYPTSDISVNQNNFFNITLNVSCSVADCGEINVSFDPEELTNYTFTTCGASGRFGPNQTQCDNNYSSSNLNGLVTVTNGTQYWTVPRTGIYSIEVAGAQGGNGTSSYQGGRGANIKGNFSLEAGQQLKILVGQKGGDVASYKAGGGGGGSFVVYSNNTPLIIAGGGSGGGGNSNPNQGQPGLNITSGGNGSQGIYLGGVNGLGGGANAGSAGGGGFLANGNSTTCASLPTAGLAFINNGSGGQAGTCAAGGGHGGFGGGSGGEWCCQGATGAGGGYSGGGATNSNGVSGGGGSYNLGTEQVNLSNQTVGNGYVVITSLSGKSGLISTEQGNTPFYTNESNPRVITLNEGESQLVTAWVNATGDPGDYLFFEYAFLNLDENSYVNTSEYNVNILEVTGPIIEITYPLNTTYLNSVSNLNFSVSGNNLESCWYSNNSGQTNYSINCNQNISNLSSSLGQNTWIIWANDTSGNLARSNVSFYLDEENLLTIQRIYPSANISVYQGDFFNITLNVSCIGNDCGWTNISLRYNQTINIVFNVKNKSSLSSIYETPFINYLNNSGYNLTLINDTEVASFDFSNYDLLIVRADADNAVAHSSNMTNLNVPIISMDRYVSRYDFSLGNSTSTDNTATLVILNSTHPISQNLPGSFSVYNSTASQQRISSLYNGINLILRTNISSGNAGIAIKEGNNLPGNYTRLHWSAHRGNILTDDGWTLFENTIRYLTQEQPNIKIISSTSGAKSFFTNISNPYLINLNNTPQFFIMSDSGESEVITFYVHATGKAKNYTFFEYAYLVNTPSINNSTSEYNVKINNTVDSISPVINLISPSNSSSVQIDQVNFVANISDNIWLSNISFYLWNSSGFLVNVTHFNVTGTNYSSNISLNLPYRNNFIWGYQSKDISGNNAISENRTLIYSSPKINVERIYPTQNLEIVENNWFNITLNVTCLEENCGNVNVSFDPNSIYVFSDGSAECINRISPMLVAEGFQVTCGINEWTFNGTNVDLSSYSGVVLLDGDSYTRTMPSSGQSALGNYVYNGGGLILFEWTAYQNYNSTFRLLNRQSGTTGSEIVRINQTHQITQGLPNNWTANACGKNVGIKNNGTILLSGSSSKDFLVINEYGSGRIVNFAIAPGYVYSSYNCWDGNTTQLFKNSANWAFIGSAKGLISTVTGDTPFYTNESNPRVITLNEGESQLVTAWVNATGSPSSHTFYEYVNVTSSNISNTTSSWTVTITEGDHQAPTGIILTPLNNTYINGEVLITTQIQDNVAVNYTRFQISLNGGNYTDIVGCEYVLLNYNCTISTDSYTDGDILNVKVLPVDTSGNINQTISTINLFVDKNAPLINSKEVIYPFGQNSIRNSQELIFKINATDANSSDISFATVNLTLLNGSSFTNMIQENEDIWNISVFLSGIENGQIIIDYKLNDTANPDNNERIDYFEVKIDNQAPTYLNSSIKNTPSENIYNGTEVFFEINISDNYKLSNSTFSNNFSGSWQNITLNSSFNSTEKIIYSDILENIGAFAYYFILYDNAGNSNQTELRYLSTEQQPIISNEIIISFEDPTYENSSQTNNSYILVNTSINTSNFIAEVVAVLYNEDGTIAQEIGGNETLFVNFSDISPGEYYFNVTASDTQGNLNSTEARHVTILSPPDLEAPSLQINKNSTQVPYSNGSILISWLAEDSVSGVSNSLFNITYPNSSLLYNSSVLSGEITLFATDLSELGNYIISLWANDTNGNENITLSSFEVVNISIEEEEEVIESIQTNQNSFSGGSSALTEIRNKDNKLEFIVSIAANKTVVRKIIDDKNTNIKEIEIKTKNWLTGKIFFVRSSDSCLELDNTKVFYKTISAENALSSKEFEKIKLTLGVEKDWIYSNNISFIKAVDCFNGQELLLEYIDETFDEGIYDVHLLSLSGFAILGETENYTSESNVPLKDRFDFSKFKFLLWVILICLGIYGFAWLMHKKGLSLIEKIRFNTHWFKFKFYLSVKFNK